MMVILENEHNSRAISHRYGRLYHLGVLLQLFQSGHTSLILTLMST